MGLDNFIYVVYRKIYVEKCLIVSWRGCLGYSMPQLLSLLANLNLYLSLRFKFINGRSRWFVNLVMSELLVTNNDISELVSNYINWQISLWTYRGISHFSTLPIYGQRTRSNANISNNS